jgi:hypothetical protein
LKAQTVFLVLPAILLLVISPQPLHAGSQTNWSHPAGAQPALGTSASQGTPVRANYDEQLGITFSQDFSQLVHNVTAVAQADSNGLGPGYFLNGLTEAGYWYQVGLGYDWPYQSGGYDPGFHFLYEVFNSSGRSVFPLGGGGGLLNFSGEINSGDNVLLRLNFSGGQIFFTAYDWNTGSSASENYTAEGSRFVGLLASSGANGFFTGLMTEWYHSDPYYGSEAQVTYTDLTTRLRSAILWVDEFNVNSSAPLFAGSHSYTFSDPTQLLYFSIKGASEYADAYTFATGSTGSAFITLSYSVVGGGTGYGAPVLNYTFNGIQYTAALATTLTTYAVDAGSTWQVSTNLPGGSETERWQTNEQTVGVSNDEESILYWHQFLSSFRYSVNGGGAGYSSPAINATEYGSSVLLNGNTSAWIDAGTSFSYPSLLPGSTSSQRWASLNHTGTVSEPLNIVVQYHHQVGLTMSYDVTEGGTPGAPELSGTQFGITFSTAIANATKYFVDWGTPWSVPDLLPGSGLRERWFAPQGTNGTALESASLTFVYHHQYAISVASSPTLGGAAEASASWENAGGAVQITEASSPGWEFEDWSGSGDGSYSGPLNSTSLLVSGPLDENATFYPGLTIGAGAGGQVTYSSGFGNGTVPTGGVRTLFVPPGAKVTLYPSPTSFLYAFSGWSGSASASGSPLSLAVDSPESVSAAFSLSPFMAAVVALAVVAAVAAVVFIASHRRGTRGPSAFKPPQFTPVKQETRV